MSDTTVGYSPGLFDGVSAYVREVRAELADLPMDDVDDLTGGMDADLTELAAECGGDLAGRLGTPRLYAAELRAAAGLPERATGPRRGQLSRDVAHARAWFTLLTEQHPGLRSVAAFLVTLRPAWWVLRGYLAAWALWSLLGGMRGLRPHGVVQLAMALVATVVSVQLGRGWLRDLAITRPLLVLGNATAVVVALIASTAGVTSGEPSYSMQTSSPPGVSLDGAMVDNIYAYDSDGKRISRVRLFAQDGRPLDGGEGSFQPEGTHVGIDANGNPTDVVLDSSGAPLRNVYPRVLYGSDPWQVIDPANPATNAPLWTPPLSIFPLAPSATATPTATSTPVPSNTASPTPSSQPSPSVTRSGG